VGEQIGDHRAIEGRSALGRSPALGVELRGDLRAALPDLM
jgi:hypothetical protein